MRHQEADTRLSDCAKTPGCSLKLFHVYFTAVGNETKNSSSDLFSYSEPMLRNNVFFPNWESRGTGPCSERGYLCGRRDLNITTLTTLVFVYELRSSEMPQSKGQNDAGVLLRRDAPPPLKPFEYQNPPFLRPASQLPFAP